MKKAVWITLIASLLLVNLAAWLAEQFTGFHIEMFYRLALVLGITVVSAIFTGAFLLVNTFEAEPPKTGHGSDTLQPMLEGETRVKSGQNQERKKP